MAMRRGDILRHFKGGKYVVICMAHDHETHEEVVVYASGETGEVYVRPLAQFTDEVAPGIFRFT